MLPGKWYLTGFILFSEEQSTCLSTLRYALNAHSDKRSAYIPRCRSDGTYAAVQCAAAGAAAGCWCVTPDGKPLPDTAVRNGKPDCSKTGECGAIALLPLGTFILGALLTNCLWHIMHFILHSLWYYIELKLCQFATTNELSRWIKLAKTNIGDNWIEM